MRREVVRIGLPRNVVKAIDYVVKNMSCFGYSSRPELLNSLVRRFLHEKVKDKMLTPRELKYKGTLFPGVESRHEI